jgi:hypothetical protein
MVFSTLSVQRCKEDNCSKGSERVVRESVKRRLGAVSRVLGYSPDSKEARAEAEESPQLEAVTRAETLPPNPLYSNCIPLLL